ncbi:uncharacterized protein LOC113228667 [Hyposmocoma kahamanoa]|uniref:uncharacterized protein LOC113228667 n=1 Tax=Hyposmocoma kahamanoa TaxID=1477025 RepID=UPI000E6D88F0|nr:uncharacterized protein LOC113228667 [Hyposmocoma kahamanoa]
MKLPFSILLDPILRPYLGRTRVFCENPTFLFSIPYTYFYSVIGFFISANHLRRHLGEQPSLNTPTEALDDLEQDFMLVHDLKIIATSMALVQYACVLAGCFTENPALFLPHLGGQMIIVLVKLINILLLLSRINLKSLCKLRRKIPAVILMTFNWLQEFCVFRKHLCICDL